MSYIVSAEFINCQALRHVKYEFSSGLNVLVADNSAGKSVFFKALKLSVGADYIGIRDLKHIVSYGEKSCGFLLTLSDGTTGGFIATPTSILYLYNGNRYSEPQQAFISKLGVLLDYSSGFMLNMLDPDQDLLFVNSRESTNYSVLKLLSDCESLEKVVDEGEEQLAACSLVYTEVSKELIATNSMINLLPVENLVELEYKVTLMSAARDFIGIVLQMFQLLERVTLVEESTLTIIDSHIHLLDTLISVCKFSSGLLHNSIEYLEVRVGILDLMLLSSQVHNSSIQSFNMSEVLVYLFDLLNCVIKLVVVPKMGLTGATSSYLLLKMWTSLTNMVDITSIGIEYSTFVRNIRNIECPVFGKVAYFENGCVSLE